ncbi:MAG: hypothetical protein KIT58_20700, partial [Planctomycetota bacterium]|nr:hypothetical protein [Planctomycetota bacterium]
GRSFVGARAAALGALGPALLAERGRPQDVEVGAMPLSEGVSGPDRVCLALELALLGARLRALMTWS